MCILQTRTQFRAIALFFSEGHILVTVRVTKSILGRDKSLGQVSLQPKFGTVWW